MSYLRVCLCVVVVHSLSACITQPIPGQQEILVTFPINPSTTELPGGSQRSYHTGAWGADLHTRQLVARFARTYDLRVTEGWPIDSLGVYCVAYVLPRSADLAVMITRLAQDPRARHVQANHSFKGMGLTESYNDPLFELQYGKYRDEVVKLHQSTRGQHVRIGIVDSNVDTRHPDLAGQITNHREFPATSATSERMHGTAIAGIIGASGNNSVGVVGLAPMSDIHAYGACRRDADKTLCSSFALAKALTAAIEAEVDILNMSLAGPYDPLLAQLLGIALDEGTIVIAAANTEDPSQNFPASLEGVFAVDGKLGYWFTLPEHLTTQAGGGYRLFQGTSVSAAGLSGVAALLRSKLSAQETNDALRQMTRLECTDNSSIQRVAYGAKVCI